MFHLVDVGLIDLISQQHQILLSRKLNEVLQVLVAQALACGVARVDEDKRSDCHAIVTPLLQPGPQGVYVHAPPLILIQVVAQQ